MRRGEFEKALPYAERAGESGSYIGLDTYKACLTALGKYEQAEQIAAALTHTYGMNSGEDCWLDWCFQTGKGDAESAFELAKQRLGLDPNDRYQDIPYFTYLIEDPNERLLSIEKLLQQAPNRWMELQRALALDELKKTRERDEALKSLIEEPGSSFHKEMAQLMQMIIAEKEVTERNIRQAAAQSEIAYNTAYQSAYYFIGFLKKNRGQTEEAVEHWKVVARSLKSTAPRLLSWKHLQREGINPATLKKREYHRYFTK